MTLYVSYYNLELGLGQVEIEFDLSTMTFPRVGINRPEVACQRENFTINAHKHSLNRHFLSVFVKIKRHDAQIRPVGPCGIARFTGRKNGQKSKYRDV